MSADLILSLLGIGKVGDRCNYREGDSMLEASSSNPDWLETLRNMPFDGPHEGARRLICACLVKSLRDDDQEILRQVFTEPEIANKKFEQPLPLADSERAALVEFGKHYENALMGRSFPREILDLLKIGVDRMDAPPV